MMNSRPWRDAATVACQKSGMYPRYRPSVGVPETLDGRPSEHCHLFGDQLGRADAGSWQIADRYTMASSAARCVAAAIFADNDNRRSTQEKLAFQKKKDGQLNHIKQQDMGPWHKDGIWGMYEDTRNMLMRINGVATQVHVGPYQHVSSASNAVPFSAARTSSGFSKDSHCVCGAVRALKESAVCMIFE
eukprot:scaffold29813_cov52-Phaeocystis_antarctica.AAC.5